MRGNDIPPTASRRIRNDHRTTATDEFEHRLLRDGVHDDIVEDDQLARLEHALALTEEVTDLRIGGTALDYLAGLDDAAGALTDEIDARVMEVCAERCRRVLKDGDDWVERGWEDARDVEAAKREAVNWLLEHRGVCRRLWGDEAEAEMLVESMEVSGDA